MLLVVVQQYVGQNESSDPGAGKIGCGGGATIRQAERVFWPRRGQNRLRPEDRTSAGLVPAFGMQQGATIRRSERAIWPMRYKKVVEDRTSAGLAPAF